MLALSSHRETRKKNNNKEKRTFRVLNLPYINKYSRKLTNIWGNCSSNIAYITWGLHCSLIFISNFQRVKRKINGQSEEDLSPDIGKWHLAHDKIHQNHQTIKNWECFTKHRLFVCGKKQNSKLCLERHISVRYFFPQVAYDNAKWFCLKLFR